MKERFEILDKQVLGEKINFYYKTVIDNCLLDIYKNFIVADPDFEIHKGRILNCGLNQVFDNPKNNANFDYIKNHKVSFLYFFAINIIKNMDEDIKSLENIQSYTDEIIDLLIFLFGKKLNFDIDYFFNVSYFCNGSNLIEEINIFLIERINKNKKLTKK